MTTPYRITLAAFLLSSAVLLAGCLENPFASSGGGGGSSDGAAAHVQQASAEIPKEQASSPEPVVTLDPGDAERRGAAIYKCWDSGCWWVVWCGHQSCDGSWSWTFPSTGRYEFTWIGVKQKCAGSPPYKLLVNGKEVIAGRIDQYGSCHDCAARRGYGIFTDTRLGTVDLEEGDTLTLWAHNDFACGIDGPGAYAAHDSLRADLR